MSTNDQDLDRDPVWDLMDQAQPPEVSPLFSRNVMREIRVLGDYSIPWWKRLLSSKPLIASGLAAAAAVAILVSVNGSGTASDPGIAQSEPVMEPALATLVEELDEELLMAAADDPSLFSDEQLLALLY